MRSGIPVSRFFWYYGMERKRDDRGKCAMVTFLLTIIYLAFIGLGIPDSLLGTAWPAIYREFGLPISCAGLVSALISAGTIAASVFSARIIGRLGTGKVTAVSTAMTAVALAGFSCSGNLLFLCLCAVPLGLGAGAVDTALNNYVSLHYSATHMSFLHCFYGIGVSVSPYILSLVMDGAAGWRGGYRAAAAIQSGIAAVLFLTLPVWKSTHTTKVGDGGHALRVLSFGEIVRLPGVKGMWCLFLTSCAIEYTCGGWGSTFLVEEKQMAAGAAARVVMFYYVGMALGRFLSGILAARLGAWQIIRIGQTVLGAALILLFLPGPSALAAAGLFLAGLGNGPLFPNFNYLTPQNFGEEVSQSVMGTQMAVSYIGILLAPVVCGGLGQWAGMGIFPFYLAVFYLVMAVATRRVKRILKLAGRRAG